MFSAQGAADRCVGDRLLDEESRQWLRCLGDVRRNGRGGIERERCLAQLHGMLLEAAQAELRRRSGRLRIEGRDREDMAHQAADDALLAILTKLGQFRGESRFTTWAYRFVILEVSAKIGRHFRRHAPVQVGDEAWERIPDRLGVDPARHAESVELVEALRAAVAGSLSERQRRVFVALAVEGVPLDALAAELNSTRNAIYKTMFDARRKIRAYLVAHGYLGETEPRTLRSHAIDDLMRSEHAGRSTPVASGRGLADPGEQASEVLAAWPAGTQVRRDTRVAPFGRVEAVIGDRLDIDVKQFHRLPASNIFRVGPQELLQRLASVHDILGSFSSRYR